MAHISLKSPRKQGLVGNVVSSVGLPMLDMFDFKTGEVVDIKVTDAECPWLVLTLTWHLSKLVLGTYPGIADVDEVCV